MLKFDDIHASYGPKEVLKGVSLNVAAGEVVALLGPNGAGKSTVLKVIAGLLIPTAGTVTFCDQNITRMPTYRRVRNGIGYLMQNGPVFGSLTVAEHQRLAAIDKREPMMTSIAGKRGGVLSGGERQRLAVRLCLQKKPKLLLLDEPSAGVAPDAATKIYARIKEQIAGTDIAVLVIEQNLQFLQDFTDRIIIMRNGAIYQNNFPLTDLANSEAIFEAFYGNTELEYAKEGATSF